MAHVTRHRTIIRRSQKDKQEYHNARESAWGVLFPHDPKNAPIVETPVMTYGPTGLYGVTNVGLVIQIQDLNVLRRVHVCLPQDTPGYPSRSGLGIPRSLATYIRFLKFSAGCPKYWQTGDSSAVECAS